MQSEAMSRNTMGVCTPGGLYGSDGHTRQGGSSWRVVLHEGHQQSGPWPALPKEPVPHTRVHAHLNFNSIGQITMMISSSWRNCMFLNKGGLRWITETEYVLWRWCFAFKVMQLLCFVMHSVNGQTPLETLRFMEAHFSKFMTYIGKGYIEALSLFVV